MVLHSPSLPEGDHEQVPGLCCGGARRRVGQPGVLQGAFIIQGIRYRLGCRLRSGHLGEGEQSCQAHLSVAGVKKAGVANDCKTIVIARQNLRGVTAHAGRWMCQRRHGRGQRRRIRAIQDAQALQCPEGMDCGRIQSNLICALVAHHAGQCWHNVSLAAFHEQALRLQSPEHVVTLQCSDELFRRSVLE